MKNVNLSIIIVNFNTREYLKKCLHSITANAPSTAFQVIVVDNNSNDGSAAMVRQEFPTVTLIVNQRNVGFAKGNNLGFQISEGQYVLLLNPDTEILPNSIGIMFSYMEANPDVGIVAPKLLNADLSLQRSCRNFPSLWRDFVKGFGLPKYFPNHPILGCVRIKDWDYNKIQEVEQPQGACLMIRRDFLINDDLFDERFFMYYEEVDLCFRMKKKNYRIFFIPDAEVIHYAGKSYSKNMPQMIFHMYRSKFFFYKKHFYLLKQALLFLFIPFEMIYRIVIYALIGSLQPQRRDEVILRIKGYYKVLSRFAFGNLSIL